ncbi:MAG: transposase [Microcoleaceae cyanobacterium]
MQLLPQRCIIGEQFNKLHKKLRSTQKLLSRKIKGSYNYQKARLKVARIHAKIKDSRLDYTRLSASLSSK